MSNVNDSVDVLGGNNGARRAFAVALRPRGGGIHIGMLGESQFRSSSCED